MNIPRALKVLLVEDEGPKQAHVVNFLGFLGEVSVNVARSVTSAMTCLEIETPDLLLLDMSLPTFDIGEGEAGGRPQGFGGIEVLRHMTLADISCPTIVITGYEAFIREAGKTVDLEELRRELTKEFPCLLKAVLHYNSTLDEWKTELSRALQSIDNIKRNNQ